MHLLSKHAVEAAAILYNDQLHIDVIENGVDSLIPTTERESGVAYALAHRHYNIDHDEVIVATKASYGHATHVEKFDAQKTYFPCLWFLKNAEYVPVMFSTLSLAQDAVFPEQARCGVGVLHPDFAYTWLESTNPSKRTQAFHRSFDLEANQMIMTVLYKLVSSYCEYESYCESYCFGYCKSYGGERGHEYEHNSRHRSVRQHRGSTSE